MPLATGTRSHFSWDFVWIFFQDCESSKRSGRPCRVSQSLQPILDRGLLHLYECRRGKLFVRGFACVSFSKEKGKMLESEDGRRKEGMKDGMQSVADSGETE